MYFDVSSKKNFIYIPFGMKTAKNNKDLVDLRRTKIIFAIM